MQVDRSLSRGSLHRQVRSCAKGDDKVARSMARATKAKIKMTLDLRSIVFDAVMRKDAA